MSGPFYRLKGIQVSGSIPLARHTSFRIGGPADYLVRVNSRRALKEVILIVRRSRIPYCILGKGTNLLVRDRGFRGAVIKLVGPFKTIQNRGDLFRCGAAALLDDLVARAYILGYGGAEFLSGIPGTVGGAVKGNAGAWGRSISEIVERIHVVDRQGRDQFLDRDEIGFSYRQSGIGDGIIITGAEIRLCRRPKAASRKEIEHYRKARQVRQPRGLSAGSFFKNPKDCPAGKLIEDCGLKGFRVGDAVVSERHANFIINLGHARASDVLALVRVVKERVRKIKGVVLKEEVRVLG
jgi:UDP-N-acetylmuramate dehydrogenase